MWSSGFSAVNPIATDMTIPLLDANKTQKMGSEITSYIIPYGQ